MIEQGESQRKEEEGVDDAPVGEQGQEKVHGEEEVGDDTAEQRKQQQQQQQQEKHEDERIGSESVRVDEKSTHGQEGDEEKVKFGFYGGSTVRRRYNEDQGNIWKPQKPLLSQAWEVFGEKILKKDSSSDVEVILEDELPDLSQDEASLNEDDRAFVKMLKDVAEETPEVFACDLSFKDIRFAIPTKDGEKIIMHPISGHVPSGSLVALMGPSGCGKSTLLDMLSNKKTMKYTGDVYLNGHQRDSKFERLISYVPQYDYGSGLETVRESIEFVSLLKADYGPLKSAVEIKKERAKHIDHVISVLGLKKVEHSRVGNELVRGISGGQKRRCTLAKGLITGPGILFADEPTSGLSATDSLTVIRSLKYVCKYLRVTVICVIHQPRLSIFELFDKLILLSDGKCVYQGSAKDAENYFANVGFPCPPKINPADWFLDCITPGAPGADADRFVKYYNDNCAVNDLTAVMTRLENPGHSAKEILADAQITRGNKAFLLPMHKQFYFVIERGFRLMGRDMDTIITLMSNALVSGLLLGLIYLQVWNRGTEVQYELSFIFTLTLSGGMTSLANVPVLVQDKVVFQNERSEGLYSTVPYLMARLIQAFVSSLVGMTLLSIIAYFMAGFPARSFGFVWLVVLVTVLAVDGLVSVFAALSQNAVQANSLASLVVTILTLFNGFTANTVSTPIWVAWICFISPFYYSFNACVDELWASNTELQAVFGFTPGFKWSAFGIILALSVIFRFLQYLVLEFATSVQK